MRSSTCSPPASGTARSVSSIESTAIVQMKPLTAARSPGSGPPRRRIAPLIPVLPSSPVISRR